MYVILEEKEHCIEYTWICSIVVKFEAERSKCLLKEVKSLLGQY